MDPDPARLEARRNLLRGVEFDAIVAAVCAATDADEAVERLLAA